VPELTAWVDVSRRVLRGRAPAGAPVTARVYAADPPIVGGQPFAAEHERLTGTSGADGNYALRCRSADCRLRYGTVAARVGTASFELEWLDVPIVGVGVSLADAVGRATAGSPVRVDVLDHSGRTLATRESSARPGADSGLPSWALDLSDHFPAGLAEGDQLQVEVGDGTFDIDVPAFSWAADVALDTVSGTGPPGRSVFVVALSRTDDGRGAGTAVGQIGADGRWRVRLTGFDLRVGDDMDLYLPAADHYLWWTVAGVQHAGPVDRAYLPHAARR
jgi:hypothetical protein